MDFFADPRLKQKKTLTNTTTTTTNTAAVIRAQPSSHPNIKVRVVSVASKSTQSTLYKDSICRAPVHRLSAQSLSQPPSSLTQSASKPCQPPIRRQPTSPPERTVHSKNVDPTKKPPAKRRTALPAARPIKKARWTGASKTQLPRPASQSSAYVERESCGSLLSDDRSECVSTIFDPDSTDEESDEKESQTRILDRFNRAIPRNVGRESSGYSASHPLLSSSQPSSRVTSALQLVNQNRQRFKLWFTPGDGHWPFKEGQDPKIGLVYPAGAEEQFPLLVPKEQEDEYQPLDDMLNVSLKSH